MGWGQDDMETWQQKDGSKIWLYCSQVQVENILENRDAVTLVINIYNREKLRPLHGYPTSKRTCGYKFTFVRC